MEKTEYTDAERLEFVMSGMHQVGSRLHVGGDSAVQWNFTPFTIKRDAVTVEDYMRDMRSVIDEAMRGHRYGNYPE